MTNTIELTTTEFRKEQKKWLDLAANSTGITLAAVIGILIFLARSKRKKGA